MAKQNSSMKLAMNPLLEPELDYLRTEDMFSGMHFVILGKNTHLKETQARQGLFDRFFINSVQS